MSYLLKFLSISLCLVTASIINIHGLGVTNILNLNNLFSGLLSKPQSPPQSQPQPKIKSTPTKNIMITLPSVNKEILQNIQSQSFPSRAARIESMVSQLQQATSPLQLPVLQALEPFGVKTKTFWITNKILVLDANPQVVQFLQFLFGLGLLNIVSVLEEMKLPLPNTFNLGSGPNPQGKSQWGVEKINAPKVWSTTKGKGVKVCIIDTGVRSSHEALRNNYAGFWYDPTLNLDDDISSTESVATTPTDPHGHGTHCAGIICGQTGTGVAPEAKWMACRGCTTVSCPSGALFSCGQFAVMPGVNGIAKTGENAPDVVSCSWGGGSGDPFYNDVINTWKAAEIVPVFAIGNSGPDCKTANSPGDQTGVISVGSTNINDQMSSFSSRGPTTDGRVAPLISAPGEKINSCGHQTDNSYQIMSGTSMATPHTAGACALILSMNKGMPLQQLSTLMFDNANHNLPEQAVKSCGVGAGSKDKIYPNAVAGFGVVDLENVFRSMKALNASN